MTVTPFSITVFAALAIFCWAAFRLIQTLVRASPMRKNVTTCGYVAPPPSIKDTGRLLKVARRLTNIQVGKLTFEGLHHLDSLDGPTIFSANHPHWVDVAILPQMIQAPCRYMAHGRVMQSLGGFLGVYLSKMGAFAANDSIKDGGTRTRQGAATMLARGENIVILPEGLTNFSPEVSVFKEGTVKIARMAAEMRGAPVYITPAYIRYGKYPGPWLARFDRQIQFFTIFFLSPFFRRGARTVVGKPISTDELFADGRDDAAATQYLKDAIVALDPGRV